MEEALKLQLRSQQLETTKLYICTKQRQIRYIDTPKKYSYIDISDIQSFIIFSQIASIH